MATLYRFLVLPLGLLRRFAPRNDDYPGVDTTDAISVSHEQDASSLLTFLRLVWGEWSSRVTGSISALLVLVGLGMSFAGAFGAKIPADSVLQLCTWLLAAICGCQAAYSVWAREYNRVVCFEERIKPKIRITPTFHVEPKGSAKGWRFVRLIVENMSETTLHNCRVREKAFTNVYGYSSGMQRYFRLGEETHANMAEHTYKRTFDLPGKGATEIIDIALLDEDKINSPVLMLYATAPTSPTLNAISRDCFPHRLTISMSSDDMPLSEERRFELSIVDGKLNPTSSVWSKSLAGSRGNARDTTGHAKVWC